MDDGYWTAYGKRMRERVARRGFLFAIGPVIVLGAVLGIVAPIEMYPVISGATSRFVSQRSAH